LLLILCNESVAALVLFNHYTTIFNAIYEK
jgi:hypothetical protein